MLVKPRWMFLKRNKKKETETYPPVKYLPFTVDESRRVALLKRDKREKGIFFPASFDVAGRGRRNFSLSPSSSVRRLLFS